LTMFLWNSTLHLITKLIIYILYRPINTISRNITTKNHVCSDDFNMAVILTNVVYRYNILLTMIYLSCSLILNYPINLTNLSVGESF